VRNTPDWFYWTGCDTFKFSDDISKWILKDIHQIPTPFKEAVCKCFNTYKNIHAGTRSIQALAHVSYESCWPQLKVWSLLVVYRFT
jgi:hypothetical protein